MNRFYLLLIAWLIGFGALAQENNSRLNVKSLKLIENDTEASRARKKDGNGDNCALIKIQTPNMGESERNRIEFQADLGTFLYPEQATGEIKLFLTEGCKTLIIKHPEYGKLVYSMPIRVEGFKTYEMVLEARKENLSSQITLTSNYVKIKVIPADAVINIDGNYYSDGNAYITVDEPHDLVVSHELYHDYEQTIYASSKEKLSYTVNLAPAYGWLIINSEPESSATVLINGVRKGVTPFRSDTLASGEYDVTLMKDMYESVTKTVVVRDNNEGEITIPMRPNFAEVTVTTDNESQIYIDDVLKGNASWKGRLIQGQHKIEARKASHRTSVRVVDVIAGKDENVVVEAPTPIYGAINVTSSPAEAKVYLDGKELDETPFVNNTILVGKHTLRFEKKGCKSLTKTIEVVEGQMIAINETLVTVSPQTPQSPQTPKSPKSPQTPKSPKSPQTPKKLTFVTLNVAINTHSKLSYGLTVGQIKRFGWFASVMTGTDFHGYKTDYECDANMFVNGNYPFYTGKESYTTLSITGGFMMKVAKPVAIKIGAGYGMRVLSYETIDKQWVKNKAESIQGLDLLVGTHFSFGGFIVSLDCVTTNFKEVEARIGLGYGF